jgi:cytochrome c556
VNLTKLACSTALLLGLGLAASTAFAGAGDDAVKGRQTCMKSHGELMKVAVPMMKGETKFDKAALDKALGGQDTACADWAKFWVPGTEKGETLETWAKAEIWSDPKGFEAAGGTWYKANEAIKAAADEAAFKTAFPVLGDSCKGCHEKFRRPKQ